MRLTSEPFRTIHACPTAFAHFLHLFHFGLANLGRGLASIRSTSNECGPEGQQSVSIACQLWSRITNNLSAQFACCRQPNPSPEWLAYLAYCCIHPQLQTGTPLVGHRLWVHKGPATGLFGSCTTARPATRCHRRCSFALSRSSCVVLCDHFTSFAYLETCDRSSAAKPLQMCARCTFRGPGQARGKELYRVSTWP